MENNEFNKENFSEAELILRDEFAKGAMQSIATEFMYISMTFKEKMFYEIQIALNAYRIADAMIVTRRFDSRNLKEMNYGRSMLVPTDVRVIEFISKKMRVPEHSVKDIIKEYSEVIGKDIASLKSELKLDVIEMNDNESLSLHDREVDAIKRALIKHKGNRKFSAKDLGISERTLYRKINEHNLIT